MATERKPAYKVIYEFQDITEDVSGDVIEVTYEDVTDGSANEITVTLDDFDKKWKNEWLVNTGARLSLEIGFEGEEMLDCGDFGIDEVHYNGFPDTVELKCLSVGEDNDLREERSFVYENQTIRQIIQKIADRNSLDVVFELFIADVIESESVFEALQNKQWENRVLSMRIKRAVQDRESDIAFLKRITSAYGVSFVFGKDNQSGSEIKRKLHVFVKMALSSIAPTASIAYPSESNDSEVNGDSDSVEGLGIELKSYSLKNKSQNNIDIFEAIYTDPMSQITYSKAVLKESLPPFGRIDLPSFRKVGTVNQKRKAWGRIENDQQAEIMAAAMLHDIISSQVEGSMNVEGSNLLIAGSTASVDGIGKLSGDYSITGSFHRINRNGGYTTRIDVKMIG